MELHSCADNERTEWDAAWRSRPLRQLVNPVQIHVVPTVNDDWGEVIGIEIAPDPPQFEHLIWRETDVCPICGMGTSAGEQLAAKIYPYFTTGFSYGLGVWVHESCFATCEETAGPAPVPW